MPSSVSILCLCVSSPLALAAAAEVAASAFNVYLTWYYTQDLR